MQATFSSLVPDDMFLVSVCQCRRFGLKKPFPEGLVTSEKSSECRICVIDMLSCLRSHQRQTTLTTCTTLGRFWFRSWLVEAVPGCWWIMERFGSRACLASDECLVFCWPWRSIEAPGACPLNVLTVLKCRPLDLRVAVPICAMASKVMPVITPAFPSMNSTHNAPASEC